RPWFHALGQPVRAPLLRGWLRQRQSRGELQSPFYTGCWTLLVASGLIRTRNRRGGPKPEAGRDGGWGDDGLSSARLRGLASAGHGALRRQQGRSGCLFRGGCCVVPDHGRSGLRQSHRLSIVASAEFALWYGLRRR